MSITHRSCHHAWTRWLTSAASVAILVAACASAPAAEQAAPPVTPAPQPAATSISAESLMATVRELTSAGYDGRGVATPGGARARAWLIGQFKSIGLRPVVSGYQQAFTFTPPPRPGSPPPAPIEGINVLGGCAGLDQKLPILVVSAHYDHLGERNGRVFPGADDNASGVAVLLELARACVDAPFRHEVWFAAFDAEESGLQGARAFLANPPVPPDRFALNVNLDMVSRGDEGELYAAGLRHYPALKPLLEPVATQAPIDLLFGHDDPASGPEDWTNQSDHGVFHRAGIPFVYFGVEDHPDYHQPTDTADKIDPAFFANAARVILDALRALDKGL